MTNLSNLKIKNFLRESLGIEGINRSPSKAEISATVAFLHRLTIDTSSLVDLVAVYAPHGRFRCYSGLNVTVGSFRPPEGGEIVVSLLADLLMEINSGILTPYEAHCRYETIHPFTDGNGRSGRALWLWHILRDGKDPELSFLHHFYYQTLAAHPGRQSCKNSSTV